ncbi:MAG TPA: hypothetical protein VG603_15180, partial [Chitinophagales bacterium]|nr:hypothetical protein [Chitinophagales bacterium]
TMKKLKYNRIGGPKNTTGDYLQTLNDEDLRDVYTSSFQLGIKMPDLLRKMRDELQKRNMEAQLALF